MNKRNVFSHHKTFYATRVITIVLMLYVALVTSWISDDAQITFRSILNFISGSGITFNYGERVQVFTHPLWFLVLSGFVCDDERVIYNCFLGKRVFFNSCHRSFDHH